MRRHLFLSATAFAIYLSFVNAPRANAALITVEKQGGPLYDFEQLLVSTNFVIEKLLKLEPTAADTQTVQTKAMFLMNRINFLAAPNVSAAIAPDARTVIVRGTPGVFVSEIQHSRGYQVGVGR
jgi:hypothetical protein